MAPRKRLNKNRDLPPFLYFDKNAGYQLKLVNGKRKIISQNRTEAIIIANEYNRIKRGGSLLDDLINDTASKTSFSSLVDKIIERMTADKKPGTSVVSTWLNDAERVKSYFTMPGEEITLSDVTDYMDHFHKSASNNVYNRKLSFLELVFDYAKDTGHMLTNPAALKIKKPKEAKKRKALDVNAFEKIRAAAPLWLKTAMDLTMQTTHAVLEVSRIEYKLKKAEPGRCGCIWYKEPLTDQHGKIYGELAIHRQKTYKSEASHVIIPINDTIKAIIDNSRDNTVSPYVVHKLPKKNSNPTSALVNHITQIVSKNISREFSNVRDQLGLYSNLKPEERPTYHEIRGLSARLIKAQGWNPQTRMGHSDSKSTKVYTEFGKQIEWVQVPNLTVNLS
jgi:hypothetical protein